MARLNRRLTEAAKLSPHLNIDDSMTDTTDTVGVAGDRIRSIIERIERVEEEIEDRMETKKEIFAEAKGDGLIVKVLKEILKLRKQDKDERDERAIYAPSPPFPEADGAGSLAAAGCPKAKSNACPR